MYNIAMNSRKLIEQYIEGWKRGDVAKIIKPLSDDCVIIESHGSTYRGVEKVKEWVAHWKDSGSAVDWWDITSLYSLKNVVVFEWSFGCTVANKKHSVEGITLVRIKGNKIHYLREYRMTRSAYEWRG